LGFSIYGISFKRLLSVILTGTPHQLTVNSQNLREYEFSNQTSGIHGTLGERFGIEVVLMVLNGKRLLFSVIIFSLIITGCSSQSVSTGDQNDKPDKSTIPITEGTSEKVDVLETYKNEEYNFSFDIPVLWKGNYRVIQKDNRISFVYTGGWPDYEPEIFAIMVMTEEEFKRANAEPSSKPKQDILGRRNNLVYFCITPITVPIPTITSSTNKEDARKFSEDWGKLFRSLNDIPNRFYFE